MKRKFFDIITQILTPRLGTQGPPTKKVAILVPISTSAELSVEEQISMRHLRYYLGDYDKYLIAPEGLPVTHQGFRVKRFNKKFFGSAAAHCRLLNHPSFYRNFTDYEFVFFYHLDSLAFSDQLHEWCKAGLDYVGPPWMKCADSPWVDRPRVGNGGFTLLKVESALKVFDRRYRMEPSTYWLDLFTRHSPGWFVKFLEKCQRGFPNFKVINLLLREWVEINDPATYNRNNDIFWSDFATYYLPEFRVASFSEGLRFAFEVSPTTCLKMNDGKMPFGCHAWPRYDRNFWEQFLVSDGSEGCCNGSRRDLAS